jgi:hypothetical protein
MRKAFYLIIISLLLNLLVLSISHGQSNINIGGIVPETEFNRNTSRGQIQVQQSSAPEQNKYLFWFEKAMGLEAAKDENPGQVLATAQTKYDFVYSSLLLWGLMIFVAVIVLLILKIIDRVIFRLNKSKSKIRGLRRSKK